MNILDTTDQNDQIQIDPNKNYLEELVGDGKKFKSPEELARGKYESDLYIEHMKARQDELRQDYVKLREEYNAGPKLKETLDLYMQELKQSQSNTLPNVQEDKSVFDETKASELIKQHLQASKQLEREEANAARVESKLKETYGPNYKSSVKQQIDQLGMTVDFFNNMARQYPEALMRTLNVDRQGETFQSPPSSTQRNDPFGSSPKRTWTYYEKMRKQDPVTYRDPKTQDQMFKDAITLGDAFQDGNYIKY